MSSYTEAYLQGPQKTHFYTRTYLASSPQALIIAIHGFNEHVGRFEHIHTPLAKAGINVFAFDQRGFGLTAKKKGNGGGYAKTSWREQLEDIEWAVNTGRGLEGCADLPVFLYGHSMGGGLSLAFPTRTSPTWPHPSKDTVSILSGVIATSPLILQTHPASKLARWAGAKLSVVGPGIIIPAEVKATDLSHDPKVAEAYAKDPLIKQVGSLRGISDMLTGGEQLLHNDYKNWPKTLPILIIHGTADAVTSPTASQEFVDALPASDKKISLYEGKFHELQNENDGIQERLVEEITSWVKAHATKPSAAPEEAASSKL